MHGVCMVYAILPQFLACEGVAGTIGHKEVDGAVLEEQLRAGSSYPVAVVNGCSI